MAVCNSMLSKEECFDISFPCLPHFSHPIPIAPSSCARPHDLQKATHLHATLTENFNIFATTPSTRTPRNQQSADTTRTSNHFSCTQSLTAYRPRQWLQIHVTFTSGSLNFHESFATAYMTLPLSRSCGSTAMQMALARLLSELCCRQITCRLQVQGLA